MNSIAIIIIFSLESTPPATSLSHIQPLINGASSLSPGAFSPGATVGNLAASRHRAFGNLNACSNTHTSC